MILIVHGVETALVPGRPDAADLENQNQNTPTSDVRGVAQEPLLVVIGIRTLNGLQLLMSLIMIGKELGGEGMRVQGIIPIIIPVAHVLAVTEAYGRIGQSGPCIHRYSRGSLRDIFNPNP